MQQTMFKPVWPESKWEPTGFPLVDGPNKLSIGRLLTLIFAPFVIFLFAILPSEIWTPAQLKPIAVWVSLAQALIPLILFILLVRYVGQFRFTSLYKRPTWRAIGFGFLMLLLGSIYALAMASLFAGQSTSNAVVEQLQSLPASERLGGLLKTEVFEVFSLMNEELLATLPFIGGMALAKQHFGWSRGASMAFGMLASILLFGVAHFSTYDWHLLQMFLIIGASRLFDTTIYIRTKNVWISYFMHLIFDSYIFITAIL